MNSLSQCVSCSCCGIRRQMSLHLRVIFCYKDETGPWSPCKRSKQSLYKVTVAWLTHFNTLIAQKMISNTVISHCRICVYKLHHWIHQSIKDIFRFFFFKFGQWQIVSWKIFQPWIVKQMRIINKHWTRLFIVSENFHIVEILCTIPYTIIISTALKPMLEYFK